MANNASGAALVKEDNLPGVREKPLIQLPHDHHDQTPASTSGEGTPQGQAVRFSSKLQEIEPQHSLHSVDTPAENNQRSEPLNLEAQAELRELSKSIQQNSQLQKRRMSNFAFEPVSLPASRVPSREGASRHGSLSSRNAPSMNSMHTPPLTPHGSSTRDPAKLNIDAVPAEITPQTSEPHKPSPKPDSDEASATRATSISQPSDQPSTRPSTISTVDLIPKQGPMFATGGTGSVPQSREPSPSRTSGATTPTTTFSRPFTPAGDSNDPYARSKRPPQSRNLDSIDARFVFGSKDSRKPSSLASSGAMGGLPRPNSSERSDRRASGFLHHHHKKDGLASGDDSKHSSMADLKRFFRFGHHSSKETKESSHSAAASRHGSKSSASGTRTPPHQLPPASVPFADDHGLQSKYGKFGKVLGSGAGGSVRLLKRSSDGVTFAVKQFRDRHHYESEREYAKKVTAEFCIGSTLHHGNIIETMDIIQERGHWYEVMEYAPYDLFAIVMTGKMSREEIACCFLQIVSGVTYLHSMGLAHRDLKLDNVVVNEHGIMKIIDFGSAIVFRYPFETEVVLATGVVGSDPYLAPEVYDSTRYDPQPTDIWSLAIIFACMSLRRFPWKAPRLTDNSYKLFVATPSPGTPGAISSSKSDTQGKDTPESKPKDAANGNSSTEQKPDAAKQEVIKGPWRLLRLLPRETRHIMSRMLELDPKKRATIEEMTEDSWISNTPVCRQIDHGQIIKATGHTHTLEPGNASDAPSKK